MEFLIEVIWATLMVGLPLAAFTLAMVWWALQRGFFQEISDTRAQVLVQRRAGIEI